VKLPQTVEVDGAVVYAGALRQAGGSGGPLDGWSAGSMTLFGPLFSTHGHYRAG
jgi:hypothetical protein